MTEEFGAGSLPVASRAEWREGFPWLVQGITARGPGEVPFDLGLFGPGAAGEVQERWAALARELAVRRVVVGHQVHGRGVRVHGEGPPGLAVLPATDGHATRVPGVLLAVTVADCVPVLAVDPGRRTVAALHAGWRGVAAGILEEGLGILADRFGTLPAEVELHLGPAICGTCYQVGPEVHAALGLSSPEAPRPVDLRAVLARRAVHAGVCPGRITVSAWCTRCGDSPFFSHRAGHPQRQVAFLGIRH